MNFFPLLYRSCHRIGLEQHLRREAPKLKGIVLDVGSKDRRYDSLFSGEVTACDLVGDTKKKVLAADIHKLPFKNGEFDNTVSFEVLEYTTDPVKALSELLRVTKPGGHLLISVPFLNYFHDDMQRFTENWFTWQLNQSDLEFQILTVGNSYTMIVDIIRRKVLDLKIRPLRLLLYPLLIVLGWFIPQEPTTGDRRYATGYFITIHKKK